MENEKKEKSKFWSLDRVLFSMILSILMFGTLYYKGEYHYTTLFVWEFAYTMIWIFSSIILQQRNDLRDLADKSNKLTGDALNLNLEILEKLSPIFRFFTDFQKQGYTYVLIEKEEEKGILCLNCGMTSYHPTDIEKLYCANCGKFHKKIHEKV